VLRAAAAAARILDHCGQLDQLPPDVVKELAVAPDEVLREARTAADQHSALLQKERQAEQEQPASKVVPTKLGQPALLAGEWVSRLAAGP